MNAELSKHTKYLYIKYRESGKQKIGKVRKIARTQGVTAARGARCDKVKAIRLKNLNQGFIFF